MNAKVVALIKEHFGQAVNPKYFVADMDKNGELTWPQFFKKYDVKTMKQKRIIDQIQDLLDGNVDEEEVDEDEQLDKLIASLGGLVVGQVYDYKGEEIRIAKPPRVKRVAAEFLTGDKKGKLYAFQIAFFDGKTPIRTEKVSKPKVQAQQVGAMNVGDILLVKSGKRESNFQLFVYASKTDKYIKATNIFCPSERWTLAPSTIAKVIKPQDFSIKNLKMF